MNNEFEQMVRTLRKSGDDIINDLTSNSVDLLHMAIGVCGESGEIIDSVKKSVIYNKPLDIENIKEELGDLLFYMEGIRQICCLEWDDIKASNIEKLKKRYPNFEYTDKRAQDRADKQ